MSVKEPVLIGKLQCECGSQYIEVQMLNMGLSPGLDHMDFWCQICKKFISHINTNPYIEPDAEKLDVEELNEELESSS